MSWILIWSKVKHLFFCTAKWKFPLLCFRRRETPVKNTENVEGAVRKEEQSAAVMSYATLSNGSGHHNNIYDNIHDHEELYDSPYEQTSHYEPSPVARRKNRGMVTINGVAVQWVQEALRCETSVKPIANRSYPRCHVGIMVRPSCILARCIVDSSWFWCTKWNILCK